MNINEISKPVTAASLNESLAKKFGQRIALERFTLEQLQDTRNKIRTKLSQVETNESFNSVQSEAYQKSKLFLDVLNAEISEREAVAEAKPDFLDMDGDGDKEEPMKKAIKDKKKKDSDVDEGQYANDAQRKAVHASKDEKKKKNESVIKEGEEDKAELVMAAKDMVDKVTGWMEDTAEMQTESMLELADAIRDEHGSQISEQFTASVKPALEAMYAAMDSTRQTLTQGVQMLTGEGDAPMMGAEDDLGGDMDMEPTMDMDAGLDAADDLEGVDEFGAAEPAAGGEEEAGRAKRESKKYNKKVIAEKSRKVASILSKKK